MASQSIPLPEPKPAIEEPVEKVFFPPVWLIVWWVVALVLVLLWGRPEVSESVFSFLRPGDNALANILTMLLVVMTAVATCVWLWIFSSHPWNVKLVPIALLAAFIGGFRFSHFTGEMWPVFVSRFTATPVLSGETQGTADLSKASSSDFPEFLGPGRAGQVSGVKLVTDWKELPKEIARWKIGAGWSGIAVVNGFGVTLEQRDKEEWITCYELRTGKLAWKHSYPAEHYNPMGGLGPRSTPTIHEGRVYAQGATGQLFCLDGASGKVLWQHNLLNEFMLQQPEAESLLSWGRAGSPLIVDNLCVVPAGGPKGSPTTLVAYDKVSGEQVWRGGSRQIAYTSPVVATLCGMRQILSVNEDTVTGHDIATGKELWFYEFGGHSNADANCSQPHVVAGDRLFLSKGYGIGCQLVQAALTDGKWSFTPIWQEHNLLKTKFTNVVFHEGYAYGLDDGILECVELETGERKWKRGRYEQGQVLLVGDVLLVQAEAGDVVFVETNPDHLVELARLPALTSQTWNNPAFAPPLLVVRSAKEAAVYELPLK